MATIITTRGITTTAMIINTTIMGTITVISMTTISMRLMATITGIMLTRILTRTMSISTTLTAMITEITPIPTLTRMAIMGTITPIRIPTRPRNFSPTRKFTATTSFSDWH